MQGKHLYEYAVIRILPKVEREEFINAGIIMFCKKANYIRVQYELNEAKLKAFSIEPELDSIRNQLKSFEIICSGKATTGTIASMDIPEKFRWLTAVRSTLIQTSRPHSGFTDDLDKTFDRLYQELVS